MGIADNILKKRYNSDVSSLKKVVAEYKKTDEKPQKADDAHEDNFDDYMPDSKNVHIMTDEELDRLIQKTVQQQSKNPISTKPVITTQSGERPTIKILNEDIMQRQPSQEEGLFDSTEGESIEVVDAPVVQYKSKPRKHILTDAEKNFYDNLKNCIPPDLLLGLKVRLFDLVNVDEKKNKKIYYSVIMMHADFVLFDKASLKTLLVIELDDRSHAHHKKQDNLKDYILKENGIPILRVKCAKSYNKSQLYNLIKKSVFR